MVACRESTVAMTLLMLPMKYANSEAPDEVWGGSEVWGGEGQVCTSMECQAKQADGEAFGAQCEVDGGQIPQQWVN